MPTATVPILVAKTHASKRKPRQKEACSWRTKEKPIEYRLFKRVRGKRDKSGKRIEWTAWIYNGEHHVMSGAIGPRS